MAAQICYVRRAKVGPTKIEMMRVETHAPGKKEGKNAHNRDEPVPTQKDDKYDEEDDDVDDDDVDEGEDDHTSEGEDDDEDDDDVDEGEDDHTSEGEDGVDEVEDDHASEGEDDHMGEGEDDHTGEGEDDVDEGEDDQMGEREDEDVQNPSLLQCVNDYVQTTSDPLKEDHYVGPLETFTITVQGTCLDPFIPTSTKARYWALCSSRGAILHSRLHLHYIPKAAAAAVVSVVELADSIWAATPDLPISTFDGWIADAKELEAAGLDVSFLRERIEQLRAFVSGKQGQPLIEQHEVRRRYGAVTRELREMEGQIGRLMKKKEELGRVRQEVAALLPDLWLRAEACWDAFAELVAASW